MGSQASGLQPWIGLLACLGLSGAECPRGRPLRGQFGWLRLGRSSTRLHLRFGFRRDQAVCVCIVWRDLHYKDSTGCTIPWPQRLRGRAATGSPGEKPSLKMENGRKGYKSSVREGGDKKGGVGPRTRSPFLPHHGSMPMGGLLQIIMVGFTLPPSAKLAWLVSRA